MKRLIIFGVPEHRDFVADTIIVEGIAKAAHGLGGVPLLSQDDHLLPLSQRWLDQTVLDKPGNGLVEIVELFVLPVIDPFGVILTNPLTPPMQDALPPWLTSTPGRVGSPTNKRWVVKPSSASVRDRCSTRAPSPPPWHMDRGLQSTG